jgi:hypothetical protein
MEEDFSEWSTLAELEEELGPICEEIKRQHKADGLYPPENIKIYVDMYRKSIIRHFGIEFLQVRTKPEYLVSCVNKRYGKTFEVTKLDKYDMYPAIHLKEVRTK